MKILTVLTYYSPHWTGLTAHAARVAEGLAARGHQVTVLTTRYRSDLPRDERINGVRVVRIQPVARFSRGMVTPAFPWAAAALIRQHDVVQIHTPLPEAPIVAALCRLLRRPLLMTHHGDLVMPRGPLNLVLEALGYWLTLGAGKLAHRVTSYSKDYAEHSRLLSRLRGKLSYVYPPVVFPQPDPEAASRWKAELGMQQDRLIGFAGRWVEEKGFDNLLRAMPSILQEEPRARLVFAGEHHVVYEDFYERCRRLIEPVQERVSLLGLIEDMQRMADFYAMCDLFVLPSRTDMMALVQIEAMLCGTPVVASDIPGARVVVRETGYGLLAPPNDPTALADTVLRALRAREQLRPDPERVRQIFNADQSIQDYEGLLAEIARGAPGDRPERRDEAPRLELPAHETEKTHQNAGVEGSATTYARPGPTVGAPNLKLPAVQSVNGSRPWSALSSADHALLDRLLFNEADMAFRRRARILMDYLELQHGDRVIDLGCGMGFYLMLMARMREIDLYGFDQERPRLLRAQSEVDTVSLLQGDLYDLPFRAGSFDKVLLSEVLEHLEHDRHALKQIYRLLRPGGVLAISVPHARYPFWWDPINRTWTSLGGRPFRRGPLVGIWTNHTRLYQPAPLAELLAQAGFEVEILEQATHYCFPFSHFLVYGIGKPLLERQLLPARLANSADRFRAERNSRSLLNPINAGVAAFRAIDRINERGPVAERRTFVNVLVKARKPVG